MTSKKYDLIINNLYRPHYKKSFSVDEAMTTDLLESVNSSKGITKTANKLRPYSTYADLLTLDVQQDPGLSAMTFSF